MEQEVEEYLRTNKGTAFFLTITGMIAVCRSL
jgi:hypothetical protein